MRLFRDRVLFEEIPKRAPVYFKKEASKRKMDHWLCSGWHVQAALQLHRRAMELSHAELWLNAKSSAILLADNLIDRLTDRMVRFRPMLSPTVVTIP